MLLDFQVVVRSDEHYKITELFK